MVSALDKYLEYKVGKIHQDSQSFWSSGSESGVSRPTTSASPGELVRSADSQALSYALTNLLGDSDAPTSLRTAV